MSMKLQYTPEEKTRLEIDKLYAEVVDLRSWVRRWLGGLGGLLGILTAAVSIIVATHQMNRSSQEADVKIMQAETHLAQAEKLEAQRLMQEITAQTDAKSNELRQKSGELAAKIKELDETDAFLRETRAKLAAEQATDPQSRLVKSPVIAPKALDLILNSLGLNVRPQGLGVGGLTIGFGYDLALTTKARFEADWKGHLSEEQIARLEKAVGVQGQGAEQLVSSFADINITRDAALEVFLRTSLPGYQAQTAQAFPGYEKLPADVQGGLVGLIVMRGPNMDGDRRREMRAIRDHVAAGDIQGIASDVRSMKRLWAGKGLTGLTNDIEKLARLIESAVPNKPGT